MSSLQEQGSLNPSGNPSGAPSGAPSVIAASGITGVTGTTAQNTSNNPFKKKEGGMKVWNAGQWREIQRVALEAKVADGRSSSKLLGSSNASSRRPSQMLNSSRRPSQVFGSKSQFTSHASLGPSSSRTKANREDPAGKRKKEMLTRLQEKWNRDQDKVREKVERGRAAREARCEQLLNNLATNDDLLSSSSAVFRAKMHQKKIQNEQLYYKWNTQVFEKIQGQIDKYLNPPDREMAYELGKKETAFKIGDYILPKENEQKAPGKLERKYSTGDKFKARLNRSDDPCKTVLNDYYTEESFARVCEAVVDGTPLPAGDPHRTKGLTRPVLDVTKWDPVNLQALSCGHFAQVSEAMSRGLPFKTERKVDGFMFDESDGVEASGKRKTKMKGGKINFLGVLQPGFVMGGEGGQYKNSIGSGCAAPVQDHYQYETGVECVNREFPDGKRMMQAPGALPRSIMIRMEDEVRNERLAELGAPPSDRASSVDYTASVPVTTQNESVPVEA